MGPRRLIWLGIAPSVVAHVLVLFGLYLLPEREEEIEEAECPTREERCRARCEGREIDVPTRCPPLEPCACEPVTVALAVPEMLTLPEPEPEPEPEPAPDATAPAQPAAPEPEGPRRARRPGTKKDARSRELARVLGTYGGEGGDTIENVLGSGGELGSLLSASNGTGTAEIAASGLSVRPEPSLSVAVRRKLASLQTCQRPAKVQGKLSIALTVGDDGEPTTVEVRRDTTGSTELRDCVVARIEGWTLPAGETRFDVVFVTDE